MKVLVFGRTGQVGIELSRLNDSILSLGRDDADLTRAETCAVKISEIQPDVVINAAAYTAVDRAESEPKLAQLINAEAPEAMAQACAKLNIPLVHISTDYVFNGVGVRPWMPSDPIAPLGVYGATKAAGEAKIRASGAAYAILRTSWVFSAHGTNFLKTMLRLGAERSSLSIVGDQIGGPTPASKIAEACFQIGEQLIEDASLSGTYHFAGAPDVSWAGFAKAIFDVAGLRLDVSEIPSSAYPTDAKRPLNSRLNCDATVSTFGIERPDWKASMASIVKQIQN